MCYSEEVVWLRLSGLSGLWTQDREVAVSNPGLGGKLSFPFRVVSSVSSPFDGMKKLDPLCLRHAQIP